MNYSKLCKIIPMLDSPNDAEALIALRALGRALAPETFGDVARLIEANLGPEPEPIEAKPFTGFKSAGKGPKPEKPVGEGWVWNERVWRWSLVSKPMVSRFETLVWVEPQNFAGQWQSSIDFSAVVAAAMEASGIKLGRKDRDLVNEILILAMDDRPILSQKLMRLEQLERYVNV